MKKTLIAVFFIIALLCVPQTAMAAATDDGTYKVSIQLWHAEKDEESMGNSFIAPVAQIKVENGQKTITVVSSESVDNFQFWYYTDGSVNGETAAAQMQENVVINGTTYPIGFTFPLVTDAEYVGVKFQASIMPISPSARVKIDYSTLQPVSDGAKSGGAVVQLNTDSGDYSAMWTATGVTAGIVLLSALIGGLSARKGKKKKV